MLRSQKMKFDTARILERLCPTLLMPPASIALKFTSSPFFPLVTKGYLGAIYMLANSYQVAFKCLLLNFFARRVDRMRPWYRPHGLVVT